jgi:chromosome segregation ATPase
MKELEQLQNQLKEEKELTITLEAQLLTAQEELSNLTIKTKQSPTWEQLNEVETEKDKAKKEYNELKEKLAQITHEKQVLEVQFKDLLANRLTSEEIKKDNQKLTKELDKSKSRIKELEQKVKDLEIEMLTEQVANNNILDQERKAKQAVKQELANKQVEITNFEKRKEVSDKIIKQLKKERQEKDQRIQELEQKLEMKVEVLPK